jgi:microcystin degradation protein MlrC
MEEEFFVTARLLAQLNKSIQQIWASPDVPDALPKLVWVSLLHARLARSCIDKIENELYTSRRRFRNKHMSDQGAKGNAS